MARRSRLIYLRFASCAGCQLTLLNSEGVLAEFAALVEIVGFPLASSRADDHGPVDIALVEGSVMRPEQAGELMAMRRRTTWLVAVGACAINGGINRLARPRGDLFPLVYPEKVDGEHLPLPLSVLVKVDAEIPGCPPEGAEMLHALGAILRGATPLLADYPVCMECRMREVRCRLHLDRQPCLGPISRAGCGARCPAAGVGCEGCRGAIPDANVMELKALLRNCGMQDRTIDDALQRFGDA